MGWTPKRIHPYFAHAVNLYGTPLEAAAVRLIADHFGIQPGDVENPNQPHHQVGYTEYAKRPKAADVSHKGMNYFYDEVLPLCDGCVAMPFLDGRMGLGVASEAKWFAERGLPVFVLAAMADTHLSFIYPMKSEERKLLLASDPCLVVPHIETRLRTWLIYNKTMRPYATAHLARMPLPDNFYPAEG
ncbi:MAG: hypothetical protein Q8P36_01065 [bacterium]|nr:hypothetical protein [bacterium]